MTAREFAELRPVADLAIAARATAQERHFIKRVRERFGIVLSPARYRRLVETVEQYLAGTKYLGPCEDHAPGRTLWLVRLGGGFIRVVYDETTARLVTCFPYRERASAGPRLPTKKLIRMHARETRKFTADSRGKARRLRCKS